MTSTRPDPTDKELEQTDLRGEPQRSINPVLRFFSLLWLRLNRSRYRSRANRLVLEKLGDINLVIMPGVLNPVLLRTGAILAEAALCRPTAATAAGDLMPRVLDMGTGSGIGAIAAAHRGFHVVGVDLNPDAVRCARINVLLNRVEDRVQLREGDLFDPVAGERFDLVLFNPPFFFGSPETPADLAWRSADVIERFAAGLDRMLTPEGQALIVLSTDGGQQRMLGALEEQGFRCDLETRKHFGNEIVSVFLARRPENADR